MHVHYKMCNPNAYNFGVNKISLTFKLLISFCCGGGDELGFSVQPLFAVLMSCTAGFGVN